MIIFREDILWGRNVSDMFCFFFAVRAGKDFQGYHTEKTKGTTVTKDLLLRKENAIGHGTEAATIENTRRHTAVAVTAKFPVVDLFDARPKPHYERMQTMKALAIIVSPSAERIVSRNELNSLAPTRYSLSATRIQTESENTTDLQL